MWNITYSVYEEEEHIVIKPLETSFSWQGGKNLHF